MAILSLLAAAVLGSALSLGSTTRRDVASKRALSAAMSGLDVARYRLNRVGPDVNMCMTSAPVGPGTSGAAPGECPAYSGDLGNGVTYRYYVTPQLSSGSTCGGTTATTTGIWRCVTAYGTADGVTRRTQAMVTRGTTSTSLFPFGGVVGLDFVDVNENNHGNVRSSVASNGPFTLKSCTGTVGGILTWKPGPTATMTENCTGDPITEPARSTPWTLAPLDSIYAGTEVVNDNMTVFGSAAGFSYSATGRTLKDTNNATLIINGPNPRTGSDGVWTFNFCSLTLTHVTSIKLLGGATARFLVDSGDRTGSGCGASGGFNVTNVAAMNYDSATGTPGDPTALQFFFYGSGNININNKSGFSAALYAPDAAVKVTNETKWFGAVAAKSVSATNGFDFTGGDVSGIKAPSDGGSVYARTVPGFVECRSAPTSTTDPESGC